jgi:L,D-peptidoglycan transpeptidase YkuD (ErfK/YbiS/YcfS/YnhG family)
MKPAFLIEIRALSARSTRGVLAFGMRQIPCALGRSGRLARKREGDGGTPLGRFALGAVFYRPDRGPRPPVGRARPLRPMEGWCDASADRNYNRPVRHPYPASAERLWREDGLYDVVVVVDYNLRPRVKGLGSAIFVHGARPGFAPTEGCVALALPHLKTLARLATRGVVLSTSVARRRPKQPR